MIPESLVNISEMANMLPISRTDFNEATINPSFINMTPSQIFQKTHMIDSVLPTVISGSSTLNCTNCSVNSTYSGLPPRVADIHCALFLLLVNAILVGTVRRLSLILFFWHFLNMSDKIWCCWKINLLQTSFYM